MVSNFRDDDSAVLQKGLTTLDNELNDIILRMVSHFLDFPITPHIPHTDLEPNQQCDDEWPATTGGYVLALPCVRDNAAKPGIRTGVWTDREYYHGYQAGS